jgi:hypothetical protein
MSMFDAELRKMLDDGESRSTAAAWFIRQMASVEVHDEDLSPFERAFWREIEDDYARWLRDRKLN